jgi:putative restriction endonuclease
LGPLRHPFSALTSGEFFLFKLHAPENFIVGGGVFAYANILPCSLAWEAFAEANGATSLSDMRARIIRYRRSEVDSKGDSIENVSLFELREERVSATAQVFS